MKLAQLQEARYHGMPELTYDEIERLDDLLYYYWDGMGGFSADDKDIVKSITTLYGMRDLYKINDHPAMIPLAQQVLEYGAELSDDDLSN